MSRAVQKPFALVDIGNSTIKVARVDHGTIGPLQTYALEDLGKLVTGQLPGEIGRVVIGCSGDPSISEDLAAQVFARGGEAVILTRECVLPYRSLYATGQAGVDRLANVAAAIAGNKGRSVIIVDAGSAITVEMIGARDVFYGGVILPGFALMAAALNAGTASLPLVRDGGRLGIVDVSATAPCADNGVQTAPPADTQGAIRAGIMAACAGGVERVLQQYFRAEEMTASRVIFTGGDGGRLLCELGMSVEFLQAAHPESEFSFAADLTLRGLMILAAAQ